MAYVSIEWSKNAASDLRYILKERGSQDVTDSNGCSVENAITDFKSVRIEHGKNEGNQALHVVQSFNASDSQKLTPEECNAIGKELAEENFPNHQFVIRTHTDKEHLHNHIVVNTVNHESGRKIENKRVLIDNLRRSSDKLCIENGLSVIQQEAHERAAKLPRKVQQMVRAGKKSYIYDLSQKADVARSISTSFDEYRDTLAGFGIRTVIEEKNISYFYPGKERGKRGGKLGHDYDKSGLIEAFKANDERFAQNPSLKTLLYGQYEQVKKYGMPAPPENMSNFTKMWDGKDAAWNNYTQHTKITRRESENVFNSERKLISQFVPASELKKAREKSILEYCKHNKIELTKNDRGETVFKGREFVSVSEFEFKNNRNGTRGSLVDLVAAHKNVTFLQAVAQINNNPKLLLLEQHTGEVRHYYRSFYIPKQERADWKTTTHKVSEFLKSFGTDLKVAGKLQEHGHVQVSKQGGVRLFAKEDSSSALEFVESSDINWTKKKHGTFNSPFAAGTGKSTKTFVFCDPMSALRNFGLDIFENKNSKHGFLALMEPSEAVVDRYIASNPHVKSIFFISSPSQRPFQVEVDLFNKLKRKYQQFGVQVEIISHEKSREMNSGKEVHGFDLIF